MQYFCFCNEGKNINVIAERSSTILCTYEKHVVCSSQIETNITKNECSCNLVIVTHKAAEHHPSIKGSD
jgi:hypothetical protein